MGFSTQVTGNPTNQELRAGKVALLSLFHPQKHDNANAN